MHRGRSLRLPGGISPRLASTLPRLQETLAAWFDDLQPVPVRMAPPRASGGMDGRPTGAFFSLGVDSFFTFLRHRPEIDHLVLVHGFDIQAGKEPLWEEARDAARRVAERTGTSLVLVRTNARTWLDRHMPWAESHGAALAHVALVLAPWLRRIYVASSFHEDRLFPYGSHPDIDPLWSTEDVDIVHDGCDATRIEKIRALVDEPVAMDHLRVCWQNPEGVYNCGRCRKCFLVMMGLDAVGGLDRCATLPHGFRNEAIRAIDGWGRAGLIYLEGIRDAYRGRDADPRLLHAVEHAIAREKALLAPGSMD